MHRNFADWYHFVSVRADGPTLVARWRAVESFANGLKLSDVPSLARMFYCRPTPAPFKDGLCDAAKAEDAAFLMENNERELSVLAAGAIAHILSQEPSSRSDAVALGVTCMEAQGLRKTGRIQGIVDEASRYLAKESVRVRTIPGERVNEFDATSFLSQLTAMKTSVPQTDTNALLAGLESACKSLLGSVKSYTESINQALEGVQGGYREQTDIVWWLFSEHTLDGMRAFSEMAVGEACLRGARDLDQLTQILPGPFAAPAFLKKMLRLANAELPGALDIASVIDSCDLKWKRACAESYPVHSAADCCPLLFAVTKSAEAAGGNWGDAFGSETGLHADDKLPPVAWAQQAYLEMLFVRSLKG
ncbi:MAG: GTPase-associated system all-helical protein GASH [Bryobacteraceae bacterium]|nr:GTPase-associated system all-helical protein GASH [Bryobacteraceae bacterium]